LPHLYSLTFIYYIKLYKKKKRNQPFGIVQAPTITIVIKDSRQDTIKQYSPVCLLTMKKKKKKNSKKKKKPQKKKKKKKKEK
jgi:hypothetical protein